MTSRRRFMGSLLATPLAAGMFGAAQAQPLTTLRIGAVPAEFGAQVYYASDMGFFQHHGLDVTIEPFTNGGAIAEAVASGSLDIGLADTVSMISAHEHGLPFLYLAPGVLSTTAAPLFALVVPPNSAIRSAKDLNNKTFGINGLKNLNQLQMQSWIDKNGGDSKSVKWFEIPFPLAVPALAQGRLDAALLTEPFVSSAMHDGYRVIEMNKNTLAPTFLGGGWIATKDWAPENPVAATAFIAAMSATAAWANRNATASAEILSKYAHIPLPVVLETRRYLITATFDAANVQPVIDACAQYGIIEKTFPAADLFYRKG